VLRIFIALKNPSQWSGFEPTTFGSSGQHANHYTTKAIIKLLTNKLSTFNSGHTCYHEFLSFRLLSKKQALKFMKIQLYLLFCMGVNMVSHVEAD
jgi:hypothetical protein